MNLYIGDMHLGHRNCLHLDNRPFSSVQEMNSVLIELWNGRVQKDDDVYVLGDFCYRSEEDPVTYLRKLKGKKHLIVGNHDVHLLKNTQAMSYFETVEKQMVIKDRDETSEVQVFLSHYPTADYPNMYHGAYHVYAHIHANKNDTYEFMKTRPRALNAGCMINHYTPALLMEMIRNNQLFQNEKIDHPVEEVRKFLKGE